MQRNSSGAQILRGLTAEPPGRFKGTVTFDSVELASGLVSVSSTQFGGGRSVSGSRLGRGNTTGGSARFSNARFSGARVSFARATFAGYVSFGGAQFDEDMVSFKDAMFDSREVSFNRAQFEAAGSFSTALYAND